MCARVLLRARTPWRASRLVSGQVKLGVLPQGFGQELLSLPRHVLVGGDGDSRRRLDLNVHAEEELQLAEEVGRDP